ncbi:hypothetical protein [Bradyrhizobium sp.]|uniref:hypothetical protein n=1 Tax=Bradyrhizobium sp. TaxID=376 RepID=UPI003C780FBE
MTAVRLRRLLLAACALIGGTIAFTMLLAEKDARGDLMLEAHVVDLSPLERLPPSAWQTLAGKRIYFGHQSVGDDILAGVAEIGRRQPQIHFEIVASDPAALRGRAAFAQSYVGSNGDPESKLRDFTQRMVAAGPGSVDIAFIKLCYVDVVATTRTNELFALYKETMAKLEQMLPQTKFLYVTVPLTAQRTGFRTRVKRLLGMVPGDDADNRSRQAFNELVRSEYRGKRPFFDVAAAESALPDGKRVTCSIGSDAFPCLAQSYTTDGGHLNDTGRLTIARELLLELEKLVR